MAFPYMRFLGGCPFFHCTSPKWLFVLVGVVAFFVAVLLVPNLSFSCLALQSSFRLKHTYCLLSYLFQLRYKILALLWVRLFFGPYLLSLLLVSMLSFAPKRADPTFFARSLRLVVVASTRSVLFILFHFLAMYLNFANQTITPSMITQRMHRLS